MNDLQATVEIAVDLGKFCNVDLFQRGFYQVAINLVEPAHPHAKVEVHILKNRDKDHFCPARVSIDGLGAVSKCLQVLYKREEFNLNHTFLYRVHCLLDSQNIIECLGKFNFQFETTLLYSSVDDFQGDIASTMEEVSKRRLKLELDPMYGLYANTLVLFDYGYMAAVEISVHGSLVALHQPLLTMPGIITNTKTGSSTEPVTLESILFRTMPGISTTLNHNAKKSNAMKVHAELIEVLLTVYAHMQNYYLSLLQTIPKGYDNSTVLTHLKHISSRMYSRVFEASRDSLSVTSVDVSKKVRDLTLLLKDLHSVEEIVNQVNMNLATTCSLLLALWSYVLDTSCLNKLVRNQLVHKSHKQRVGRFQTGFFTTHNPRACFFSENRYAMYNWMANEIRSSGYFAELPLLPIHNDEADGTIESLPIIFEDVYTHQCKDTPSFRLRSPISLFSRPSNAADQQVKSLDPSRKEILNISEEVGCEEFLRESSNSSVSSCGEACENMMINEKTTEVNSNKKKKRPSIFRKLKGSYKVRMERLSVSDDESTKVTLAEFLSSIDNSKSAESNMAKPNSTSTAKIKPFHRKLKVSFSAHEQLSDKQRSIKNHVHYHRRSFDEGFQKLVERNSHETNACDGDAQGDPVLTRSLSSSLLDQNKVDSSFDRLASVRRVNMSRNLERRFRDQLRSETSEEPESGISERSVAMSMTNTSMIKFYTTVHKSPSYPSNNVTLPQKNSVATNVCAITKEESDAPTICSNTGIIKSQSYSTGMERLQKENDDSDKFPRPHSKLHTTISCEANRSNANSTTGGFDRMSYGMGLYPGGGSITTADLSPFDEPELIQAWGQLLSESTTSENASNSGDQGVVKALIPAQVEASASKSQLQEAGDMETNMNQNEVDSLKADDVKLEEKGVAANAQGITLPVNCLGALECEEEFMENEFALGLLKSQNKKILDNSIARVTLQKVNEDTVPPRAKTSWEGTEPVISFSSKFSSLNLPLRSQRERRHIAEKAKLFARLDFPGRSYTDIPSPAPLLPYFVQNTTSMQSKKGKESHLVVCVHGLDGNSNDLRLVRTYIELAVSSRTNISFLMSRSNQEDTYTNIETMTERLVGEILDYLHLHYTSGKSPTKISFIGHSLGCLLIRSVVAHDHLRHLRSKFHTFLSFSGPHLGTLFNNSALVSTGLWLIQKWKKSACLLQLACKDHADLRKTYLYKLSKKKGLEYFQNILLVASASDRYVPYHSARVEMCKQAFRDKTAGPPYQEMLNNIMKPVINKPKLNLVRYHIAHSLPGTNANTVIGRAAHIAVLDSEVFLEKFFLVTGFHYFM